MPHPEDSELVARALRQDERAFRDLIQRHHAMAYAAVRSVLGDRDEVQDVMQMVYLKAYQGLAGFRGDARFSTWLYQIAPVSYTHLRAHETPEHLVCRLLLEK